MKSFILGLIATCTVLGSSSFASIKVPSEVSALLQEANYQQILNQKTQAARESGHTLHVTSFDILDISPAKYIYVMLATSISADVTHNLTPAGAIVGSIHYGPLGEIGFDGIYFKPVEEGPGGASVGNN